MPSALSARYTVGPFRVDAAEGHLWRDGAPVEASAQTLRLLGVLAGAAGRVVTRDALVAAVWHGVEPEDNAITVAVSKLRAALAEHRDAVETVRERGYRLALPVVAEPVAGLGAVARVAVEPAVAATPGAQALANGLATRLVAALVALGVDACPAAAPEAVGAGGRLSSDIAAGAVGRVRLTLRLVGADGRARWTHTATAAGGDAHAAQDTLASAAAERLSARLDAARRAHANGAPATVAAAAKLGEARYLWARRMEGRALDALAAFEDAASADPGLAAAWAGAADVGVMLPHLAGVPPREAFPRARAHAEQALALDPDAAEPLVALAHVAWRYDWDAQEAERLLDLAVARQPGLALAHGVRGMLFVLTGRTADGLASLHRAQALDPDSVEAAVEIGYGTYFAGQPADAAQSLDALLARAPGHPMARLFRAYAAEALGHADEAADGAEAALAAGGPHPVVLSTLAWLQARAGRTAAAEATLAAAEQAPGFAFPSWRAPALAALGRRDDAFAALDRATDERDPMLIHLAAFVGFDALRADPRFDALALRVGLSGGAR